MYLLVGSYGLLATTSGLPPLFDGYEPRTTHLLAAGGAVLLLFALGTQLLSRFTGTTPQRWLVSVVLPAGAIGPGILAGTLYGGWLFRVGAIAQSVVAVGLGLSGAFVGWTASTLLVHRRLNLGGFLGLTIIGFAYLFYSSDSGRFRGANDRTAFSSIALVAGGLVVESVGYVAEFEIVASVGSLLVFARCRTVRISHYQAPAGDPYSMTLHRVSSGNSVSGPVRERRCLARF